MIADYEDYDGLGLAALVADRKVTPLEVLETAYAAMLQKEPAVSAISHRFFDLGRAAVAAGLPDGPFRGVPLFVKDAGLAVAGTPTSFGSRLFEGTVCAADDTLATRLKAAGMAPVARTRSPEFALSFTTEPAAFGPTRNPWAADRSAGGSSGGAAAAVAAGIIPLAQASDGAGSIRVPAAHCGVFGFKPSRMRNPVGPRMAEIIAGMGAPHAITRSVRDSAALLDATAGADIGDPYAVAPPVRPFLAETMRDPPPLRIGLVTAPGIGQECAAAVRDAAALCSGLGHHVEEAEIGHDDAALKAAWRLIAGAGLANMIAPALSGITEEAASRLIEPVNLAWMEEGRGWSALDYVQAVATLHRTGRVLGAFFSRFDVLMSPVTAEIAPPLGFLAGAGMTLDAFFDRFWAHAPFTPIFNATGCPAMSVPLFWTEPLAGAPRGLPVGVHFGAGPGADGLLFALAGQLERARPWAGRRPALGADRSAASSASR